MKMTFPSKKKLHFIGIAGSGMYPLACFLKKAGNFISGSDRSFDNGKCKQIKNLLLDHGIDIFAQDGQFAVTKCDSVIYSGAIEETIADYKMAKKFGEEGININYVYGSALPKGKKSLFVFCPEDIELAAKIFRD